MIKNLPVASTIIFNYLGENSRGVSGKLARMVDKSTTKIGEIFKPPIFY